MFRASEAKLRFGLMVCNLDIRKAFLGGRHRNIEAGTITDIIPWGGGGGGVRSKSCVII